MRTDIQTSIKIQFHEWLEENVVFFEFKKHIVEAFEKRVTHLEVVLGFKSLKSATVRKVARDQRGMIPLHWAAARSNEEVLQLLLRVITEKDDKGTEIDAKDDEGMTALHHAASTNNVKIVGALLEKGAKINVIDLHDWTPGLITQIYAKVDICNTLSGGTKMTIVPGTRAGLDPSRWVKTIGSSGIRISKDGLTAISSKMETLPNSINSWLNPRQIK